MENALENDEVKKQTRTIGTTSLDARTIFEKLKTLQINETISYQELSNLTGRDIIKHRHILSSARNMALRESIVFDVIHNYGIKRLSDSDVVKIESVRPLSKARSAFKNGVKRISCARNISNEEQIRVNASLSLFGTLALFTKPKAVDKIVEEQAKANYGELSFDKLVSLFDPQNKLKKIPAQDTT